MTNELQVFNFNGNDVREITDINGEPWFIGKDVCEVLGISKHRDAMSRLDDDERRPVTVDTLGGRQQATAISESGLYSLILRSNKPEAKTFKKWITSDVLPSIRKTGTYTAKRKTVDEVIHDALLLSSQRLKQLEEKVKEDAPKVTAYEEFINTDGYISLRDTAKLLKVAPQKLNSWLREKKLLSTGGTIPAQTLVENGYMVVRPYMLPGGGIKNNGYVTPRRCGLP